MSQNKKISRGIFLTVLLILGILGSLISIFLIARGVPYNTVYAHPIPSWYKMFELVSNMASVLLLLVGIVGIFRWTKWGIYLLGANIGIRAVYYIVMYLLVDSYTGFSNIISTIIGAGLWYWAIKRKIRNFS